MRYLILRNLRLYFRDRTSVFFSMLSVFIVIALYALFLFDNMMQAYFETLENGRTLLHLWLIGGLLSIVSLTTTLASYGIMVNDRVQHIMKDFYASSIKRWKLVVSYIIAACITGLFMSIFTLIISQCFLIYEGYDFLGWAMIIKLLGVSLLSVLCGSSMMFFLSSFLKTASSFSNASTMIGTLAGFIMGIYMPIGVLPSFAQNIIRFFPLSHGSAAFRRILMDAPLQQSFQDLPANVLPDVEEQLGIVLHINNNALSIPMNLVVLIGAAILFLGLSIIIFRKQNRSV